MNIQEINIGDILYDTSRTWDVAAGEVVEIDGRDSMVTLEATDQNIKTTYRIHAESLSRGTSTQGLSLQSATNDELIGELSMRFRAMEENLKYRSGAWSTAQTTRR